MPEFAGFYGDPFARGVNPPDETAEGESQGKKADKTEEKKITWPKLHLTSIFWSPKSPMATINGDVIEPGDTLGREGAVEVKAISEDSVTLVYTTGGGRVEKTLTPGTKLGS